MIDPATRPEVIAAAAARIADLARRDLDAIYTARDATTLAHVHAACEVSRALAAAAEAIAYVAEPEADPGRTHVFLPEGSKVVGDVAYAPSIPTEQPEGWCTDCEPGPDEPEAYRCRWCGDDLSDRADPPATEATCVYRIGGGARPGGCTATILAGRGPTPPVSDVGLKTPLNLDRLVACTRDPGHEGQHIGSASEHDTFSHVVWSDGDRRIDMNTGSVERDLTVPPAGVVTASGERPTTRVVLGPFDYQADPAPCGGEGEPECGPAPSPSPFHRCGATPTVVGVESGGCTRIKGHPGEHQAGVPGEGIARWTPAGVSIRYGAGAW